ncbi:MAG: ABC transporter permease [Anaerolineales bacterium]|nr:ABC transporter permease [Anaerolineales bacterium]
MIVYNRTQGLSLSFNIKRLLRNNTGVVAAYLLVVATFLISGSLDPDVFRLSNVITIVHHMVSLGLVSIGQSFCILSGSFDLSVGSVISLTTLLFSGTVFGRSEMILPALLLVLSVGLSFGLINGLMIAKARINPFVTTLSTMLMGQGAALMYYYGPYGENTPGIKYLGYGTVGPVPVAVLVLAAFFFAALIVLTKTRFGLHVYAIGGDIQSARLSGVDTIRVRIATHVICSFMAIVTGIYFSSRLGCGDPYVGIGVELESIAAVCIAGTSLFGGEGTLWGTLGGVLLLAMLSNAFNHLNVETMIQLIARGLIIIVAVAVYSARRKGFGS